MEIFEFLQRYHDWSFVEGFRFHFSNSTIARSSPRRYGNTTVVGLSAGDALQSAETSNGTIRVAHPTLAEMQPSDFVEDVAVVDHHCDLLGLRFIDGACHLRLALVCDGATDDVILRNTELLFDLSEALETYSTT